MDRRRAYSEGADLAGDLRALRSVCLAARIPFGVILWGNDASSDRACFEDALAWVRTVAEALGAPDEVVFQSWVESRDGSKTVPVNLPEDDPAVFSHTRLINEGLALLRSRR